MLLLCTIFFLGYMAIVFEHSLKLNKAGAALLTGTTLWALLNLYPGYETGILHRHLSESLDISGLLHRVRRQSPHYRIRSRSCSNERDKYQIHMVHEKVHDHCRHRFYRRNDVTFCYELKK